MNAVIAVIAVILLLTAGALDLHDLITKTPTSSKPSDDGRRIRHQKKVFHSDENGVTSLEYDVEHLEDQNFLHLEEPSNQVKKVYCDRLFLENDQLGSLSIVLGRESGERLLQHKTLVITGDLRWGCKNNSIPISIFHKIVAAPMLVHGAGSEKMMEVEFQVEPASVLDVYHNAEISFHTTKFPESHNIHHSSSSSSDFAPPQRRLLEVTDRRVGVHSGGFFDFFTDIYNTVTTLGGDVAKAVSTVVDVIKVLATNESISFHELLASKDWSWNLNGSKVVTPSVNIDSSINVSCMNCYVKANAAVTFNLNIQSRKLNELRLVADGGYSTQVGVQAVWMAHYSKSGSKLVATIHVPPITIPIVAIPFVLKIDIPITLGYSLNVTAKASVSGTTRSSGSFAFGASYTPQAGLNFIQESDFSHSGSLSAVGSVGAQLVIYVLPTIELQINYIGGPNLGIKGFLESLIEYRTGDHDPCSHSLGKLTVNLGLQITVGAQIDIKIASFSVYKSETTPATVYSATRPILSGCIANLAPADQERQRLLLGSAQASHAQYQRDFVTQADFPGENENWQEVWDRAPSPPASILLAGPDGSIVGVVPVQNVGCVEGTTWRGKIQRGTGRSSECSRYPPFRELSIQAVETFVTGTGPILTTMVTVSDSRRDASDNKTYACVQHMPYEINAWPTRLEFNRLTGKTYSYCSGAQIPASCSCAAKETVLPKQFDGKTDANLDKIYLQDGLQCTNATLYRVTPKTTASSLTEEGQWWSSLPNQCGF